MAHYEDKLRILMIYVLFILNYLNDILDIYTKSLIHTCLQRSITIIFQNPIAKSANFLVDQHVYHWIFKIFYCICDKCINIWLNMTWLIFYNYGRISSFYKTFFLNNDLFCGSLEGLNNVLLPRSGDLMGDRRLMGLALGVSRSGLPSRL